MFKQTYTITNNNAGNSQGNFVIPQFKAGVKFSIDSYIPGVRPGTSLGCNNLCTSTLVNGNGTMGYVDLSTFNFGTVGTLGNRCSECKLYIYPGGSMTYSIYSDKMPFSQISPVIDGLKSSVNEIIPYVSFIGLGFLVCIIGFVAFRWLVNLTKYKILSNFKR